MRAIEDNQSDISPTIKYFIAKIDNESGVDDLKRLAIAYVRGNRDFNNPGNPADKYFFQLLAIESSSAQAPGGFVPADRKIGFLEAYEMEAMEYVYKLGKCKIQLGNVTLADHIKSQSNVSKNSFGFFNKPVVKSVVIPLVAGVAVGAAIMPLVFR